MLDATIQKVSLDSDFSITYNKSAEDPDLSFGAKGLLWYMISRPADWKIYRKQLASIYQGEKRGNGIDAVNSWLDELIKYEYVIYEKTRNNKGQWDHKYYVFPMRFQQFQKMFPERVKPGMVKPGEDKTGYIPRKEGLPNKEKEKSVTPGPERPVVSKVSFKNRDGIDFELTDSDIYFRISKANFECTTSEVQYAMKALDDCKAVIYDWWQFFTKTIENYRKLKKHERTMKCKTTKSTKNSKSNYSAKDTSEQPRPASVSPWAKMKE